MKLKRKNLLKKIDGRIKNIFYNITLNNHIIYDIVYSTDNKRMKIKLSYPRCGSSDNMVSIFVDFFNVKFARHFLGLASLETLDNTSIIMDNENIISEKLNKILLLRYYICQNYK